MVKGPNFEDFEGFGDIFDEGVGCSGRLRCCG